MSSNTKTPVISHSEADRALYRVAIVGAGSLKGKEVAEVLGDRNFPAVDVKLLDDDETIGQLEALRDEVTFVQNVRAEQFENIDFTFFASDQDSTRKTWNTARKAGSAIIDLSFALEDEPGATVRSPWVERQLGQGLRLDLQPGPAVIAHPASVVLALLLLRVQKTAAIRRVVCTVLEPASEHGQKGMDELHEQTVNLLSFQQLPKNIFDTQVAFNLVSRYGPQASPPLASVESRILKHYRKIAGENAPLPSLSLVQAPIFHGHAFSIHIELQEVADLAQILEGLAGEHVTATRQAEDAPSNVNAAGQGDVMVSVTSDVNDSKSFWMWAASDNLRVAAATAVECAETMAITRPKGTIQ